MAIPLIFEIIFVSILAQVHQQTQAEIQSINHQRQVSDTTNSLVLNLFELSVITRDNSPSLANLSRSVDSIKSKVYQLLELVKDSPKQSETVADTQKGLQGLAWLLADYGQGHTKEPNHKVWMGDHFEDFSKARRSVLFQMASPKLLAMAQEQQALEKTNGQNLANYRRQVKVILVIGLILSALISWTIVWIISRGLTNRLKVMTDNAWRLASSIPLNPVVSGTDEIAYLDRVFHSMQDALEESNHRERALLENAVDIICSIDAQGYFSSVSPASLQMLGYAPDELLGVNYLDFVIEENKLEAQQSIALIRREQTATTFETCMLRKDGAAVDVLWSAQWLEREQSMFCIMHDISEQKDAERMKQEVVKMVTHDLKTPLTTIQIFLEMLQAGVVGQLTENGADLVTAADRNAERMLALIGDLLDIEKIKSGMMDLQIEQIPLATVFAESYQSVSALANEHHLFIDLQPSDIVAPVDSHRIVRVLVNLISNAIKFSPANGSIVVLAERTTDGVKISVTDQGRGIPAHMLSSIFEPFQQVQTSDAKQKGGSGLGLAICKAIVELHGGTIGVQSEENKGSTFFFTLPKTHISAGKGR